MNTETEQLEEELSNTRYRLALAEAILKVFQRDLPILMNRLRTEVAEPVERLSQTVVGEASREKLAEVHETLLSIIDGDKEEDDQQEDNDEDR